MGMNNTFLLNTNNIYPFFFLIGCVVLGKIIVAFIFIWLLTENWELVRSGKNAQNQEKPAKIDKNGELEANSVLPPVRFLKPWLE